MRHLRTSRDEPLPTGLLLVLPGCAGFCPGYCEISADGALAGNRLTFQEAIVPY
jgi:hypothetical protein